VSFDNNVAVNFYLAGDAVDELNDLREGDGL
jgi:hypothetical protein